MTSALLRRLESLETKVESLEQRVHNPYHDPMAIRLVEAGKQLISTAEPEVARKTTWILRQLFVKAGMEVQAAELYRHYQEVIK